MASTIDSPSTATAGSPAGAALNLSVVDLRPGFCNVSRPWSSSTQVKFNVVYALPWDFQASSIYQNIPGVPIRAELRRHRRGNLPIAGPAPCVVPQPDGCHVQSELHGD